MSAITKAITKLHQSWIDRAIASGPGGRLLKISGKKSVGVLYGEPERASSEKAESDAYVSAIWRESRVTQLLPSASQIARAVA